MRRTAIAICALVLLFSGPLSGATLRVPSQYPTIWSAIIQSSPSPGDTILVAPGDYSEPSLSVSGTSRITLISEGGREVTAIHSLWNNVITITTSSDFILKGFTLRPLYTGGIGIAIGGGSQNILISDCSISGAATGVHLLDCSGSIINCIFSECQWGASVGNGATSCFISENEFSGCLSSGIDIGGPAGNVTISNDDIHNSSIAGIRILDSPNNSSGSVIIEHNRIHDNFYGIEVTSLYSTTIESNTIARNQMMGIYLHPGCALSYLAINKNIIVSNDYAGIVVDACSNPYLACNDVWGNSHYANGNYVGYITDQTGYNGNISTDPFFCNALGGDYSLAANSPALHASCGVMGAIATPGCSNQTAVEHLSWGKIKALYK